MANDVIEARRRSQSRATTMAKTKSGYDVVRRLDKFSHSCATWVLSGTFRYLNVVRVLRAAHTRSESAS